MSPHCLIYLKDDWEPLYSYRIPVTANRAGFVYEPIYWATFNRMPQY